MKKSRMTADEIAFVDGLVRQANLLYDIVMTCPEADSEKDPGAAKWLAIIRKCKHDWKSGGKDAKPSEMARLAQVVIDGLDYD